MNTRITWDQYFMGLAMAVSQRSEDSSTKHGCVLVSKKTNAILGTGYNGLISGLDSSKVDIITRPTKYKWMRHSEENACLNATHPLKYIDGGVKAYITGLPCPNCAQILAQCGIKDWYLLKRRGFAVYTEENQKDFNLIVSEMGIIVKYIDVIDIDWLKNIEV